MMSKHTLSALAAIAMLHFSGPLHAQTTPWNTNGSSVWYAPSGVNVGIGTASPFKALTIYGNGSDNGGIGDLVVMGAGTVGASISLAASGTGARTYSLLSTASAAGAGRFGVYDSSAGAYRMVIDSSGNVGIGTTNPQYKLAINGTFGAQDVIVTNSGWSDYVFRPGYRLRPLSEVDAYIQAHHRLPDIPSESEVMQKGVSLGEMQAKLLAKVEELTLHMIHEHERNDRLEQQNRELQEQIRDMQALLSRVQTETPQERNAGGANQ